MRETLDQWDFVVAAYALTVVASLLLVGLSLFWMRRAERRREALRRK